MVDRPAPKSLQAFCCPGFLAPHHRISGRSSCILLVKRNMSIPKSIQMPLPLAAGAHALAALPPHVSRASPSISVSKLELPLHTIPPHSRCQTICRLDGRGTWIEFTSRLPSASRGGDGPHESIVSPIVFMWQVKKFHKETASEKTQRTLLFHCATLCCVILPIEKTYLMRLTNWHVHLPHLNQHWCAPQPSYGAKFQTGSKLPKQDQSCLVDTIEQKQNKQLR